MRIEPGKLDRLIELLRVTETQDALGQVLDAFQPFGRINGQRLEMRTSDAARAGQRDTFAVSRYLIRYRADLTLSMRIRVDGRLYDVLAIDEPDRRYSMVLTVEEAIA